MNLVIVISLFILPRLCVCGDGKEELQPSTITQGDSPLPSHTSGSILELASPDESSIIVSGYNIGGSNYKEYFPMIGKRIGSVLDSGRVIWRAEQDEMCTFVTTARGRYTILLMYVNKGDTLEIKCFEKNGNEWKNISEGQFEDKLDDMENEVVAPLDTEGLGSRLRGVDNEWVFYPC